MTRMDKVQTGVETLISELNFQDRCKGNLGLLYHSASVTSSYESTLEVLLKIFPDRVKKLFGPQHGIVSDVQDNMVESDHFSHPHFNLPVYSLYSETRKPTKEMLEGIDTLIIDLQDVGTRVYTYISTLQLICASITDYKLNIDIVILDRPNPVGGTIIEGNVLESKFTSFVGMLPIPMRHGMTFGEVGLFIKSHLKLDLNITVVPLRKWKRTMSFDQTGLPWINPSPNLPTINSALVFPGTVLFEGTNISEGRGTTRSLEVVGHPDIKDPFALKKEFLRSIDPFEITGYELRPLYFIPTFQKHQGVQCGGFHIHVTDKSSFKAWKLGQLLCYFFYHHSEIDFKWNIERYEYEPAVLAIDLINGTDKVRNWIEKKENIRNINAIEQERQEAFMETRKSILLYN